MVGSSLELVSNLPLFNKSDEFKKIERKDLEFVFQNTKEQIHF